MLAIDRCGVYYRESMDVSQRGKLVLIIFDRATCITAIASRLTVMMLMHVINPRGTERRRRHCLRRRVYQNKVSRD